MTLLSLLLAVHAAEAAEATPARAALVTSGLSIGGELGGAVVLGAAGLGLGSLTCLGAGDRPECWGPTLGAGAGAIVGGVAGGFAGGLLGAHLTDRSARRVALWSGVGLLGFGTMAVVGNVASIWPLASVGTYGTFLAIPVGAGLAAGTESRASLSVDLGDPRRWEAGAPERLGLRLSLDF